MFDKGSRSVAMVGFTGRGLLTLAVAMAVVGIGTAARADTAVRAFVSPMAHWTPVPVQQARSGDAAPPTGTCDPTSTARAVSGGADRVDATSRAIYQPGDPQSPYNTK